MLSAIFILISGLVSTAQTTRTVLFLGNSYTGYNNLPQMVQNAALSAGDTLIFDSNTPGGQTLQGHSVNSNSLNKIMTGGWDYVVLQGQSQEPIVQTAVFNQGGISLNETIRQHNDCAVPLLYMTWGRKNGDASNCPFFPEMCTYESMDEALKESYLQLAALIDAEVSPVSAVWRYLRDNHPEIELYAGDGSHPSAAGSYAAACCFYAAIFQKDPELITFNFSLNPSVAANIRQAAKIEVYDALQNWDFTQSPESAFEYSIGPGMNEVNFNPLNGQIVQDYLWNFGDGETSDLPNPTHFYDSPGTYNVSLTTSACKLGVLQTSTSDTIIHFCNHTPTITYAEPLCQADTLWTQAADSYQWFLFGEPIPETNQYLAHYTQYTGTTFSVSTTIEGCSETSASFFANPEWSGYYFDSAMGGDPCEGDTALFTVHHIDGFLPGNEVIRWYKDGALLTAQNDEDTLLITEGGVYTVHVMNPDSDCPSDSTSYTVEFDCGSVGIATHLEESVKIFPNPATEFVTLKFPDMNGREEIQIFHSTGQLVKVLSASSPATIDIADLPVGLYFIRLEGYPQAAVRFVKE
jgi:PKD repeat protein